MVSLPVQLLGKGALGSDSGADSMLDSGMITAVRFSVFAIAGVVLFRLFVRAVLLV